MMLRSHDAEDALELSDARGAMTHGIVLVRAEVGAGERTLVYRERLLDDLLLDSLEAGTPEEVMKKIMEKPDLAAKFQNPKVQQAMMDITQNPQNVTKYYSDPDVMSLMTEMSQLFPNMAGGPPPV